MTWGLPHSGQWLRTDVSYTAWSQGHRKPRQGWGGCRLRFSQFPDLRSNKWEDRTFPGALLEEVQGQRAHCPQLTSMHLRGRRRSKLPAALFPRICGIGLLWGLMATCFIRYLTQFSTHSVFKINVNVCWYLSRSIVWRLRAWTLEPVCPEAGLATY